jgi:uncharacterized protein YrrD
VSRGDPVSWFVIEPGWKVAAADGGDVGRVDSVIGDTGQDIFNGLSVSTGLLRKARYVPAELVASITDGHVLLTASTAEFERLDDYSEPPPSEEILPPDRRR